MLYICTHVATVGVKGLTNSDVCSTLNNSYRKSSAWPQILWYEVWSFIDCFELTCKCTVLLTFSRCDVSELSFACPDGVYGNYYLVRSCEAGHTKCVYEGDKPSYDMSQLVAVPVNKGYFVHDSHDYMGVLRWQPHRRSGLVNLPSVGVNP